MSEVFSLMSAWTEYSSCGTLNKEFSRTACFAAATHCVPRGKRANNTYQIRIYKGIAKATKEHYNNNCLIDFETLNEHIAFAQSIVKFDYTIEEEETMFIVTVTMSGEITKHTFVLSWIRYVYQFPYNVITFDMYRICKTKPFNKINYFSLFNLLAATGDWPGSWGGESIGAVNAPTKYMSKNTLRDLVNHTSKIEYIVNRIPQFILPVRPNEPGDNNHGYKVPNWKTLVNKAPQFRTIEYWYDDEAFATRVEAYLYNLQIMLNHSI